MTEDTIFQKTAPKFGKQCVKSFKLGAQNVCINSFAAAQTK